MCPGAFQTRVHQSAYIGRVMALSATHALPAHVEPCASRITIFAAIPGWRGITYVLRPEDHGGHRSRGDRAQCANACELVHHLQPQPQPLAFRGGHCTCGILPHNDFPVNVQNQRLVRTHVTVLLVSANCDSFRPNLTWVPSQLHVIHSVLIRILALEICHFYRHGRSQSVRRTSQDGFRNFMRALYLGFSRVPRSG